MPGARDGDLGYTKEDVIAALVRKRGSAFRDEAEIAVERAFKDEDFEIRSDHEETAEAIWVSDRYWPS